VKIQGVGEGGEAGMHRQNNWRGSVMVRRGSVWCGVAQLKCGVAQYGAASLSMVWRGSVKVRRGSVWCGVAQYGVAWLS
jgi:hypothetical protein